MSQKQLKAAKAIASTFLTSFENELKTKGTDCDIANNLPAKWIISRDNIRMERIIGSGRYGEVFSGAYWRHLKGEMVANPIAVKRVNNQGKMRNCHHPKLSHDL